MGEKIVSINRVMSSLEEAKVSVFDRGFLFGDSIYEVTMTRNKKPLFLKEHLDRLERSASKIDLKLSYTRKQIELEIQKVIDAVDSERVYIRLIITRGEGEIGLDPELAGKNNMVIIGKVLPENPSWWYKKGIGLIVADTIRNSIEAMDPNIKSGNYLNNVLAYAEAKKQGAYDAVMLNNSGQITECTTSNIWMVRGGRIITAPQRAGILEGITRKTLMLAMKEQGLRLYEECFFADDLRNCDECFITSSTKFIVPVTELDKRKIGTGVPGPTTLKLQGIYHDFVDKSLSKNI